MESGTKTSTETKTNISRRGDEVTVKTTEITTITAPGKVGIQFLYSCYRLTMVPTHVRIVSGVAVSGYRAGIMIIFFRTRSTKSRFAQLVLSHQYT